MGAVTATVVAVTAGSGVDAVAAAGVPCRVGAEAWMDAVAEWRGTKPPGSASRKPATVPGTSALWGNAKACVAVKTWLKQPIGRQHSKEL